MRFYYSFRPALIFLLCLISTTHGFCSDWKFRKGKELIPIEENELGIVAAEVVLSVLNELLRSNDKSQKAFMAHFGLEPEGIYTGMGDKGTSGFLNCLLANLSLDSTSASEMTLSLRSKDQCWNLSTGAYTTFAALINIRNSRYQSAILLIRVEIQDISGTKVASAMPSGFYVSVK